MKKVPFSHFYKAFIHKVLKITDNCIYIWAKYSKKD